MFEGLKAKYRLARMQADAILNMADKMIGQDDKGEMGVIKLVIGIFLIAILAGALLPSAINALVAGRNASWDASTLSTYDAIQILLVVAVIAAVAGIAYKAFE